jgi:transposase
MSRGPEDARKLSGEAQQALRKRAVSMVVESKLTQAEVARLLSVGTDTVSHWMAKYRAGGWKALEQGQRGRRKEEQQKLAPWQCAMIVRMMADKCPDQLKMPFVLWTREAVRMFILREYSVDLPVRTVGKYLTRWGLTPQKPLRRAIQRQPAAVEKWRTETYPAIVARAAAEGAEIHWGDETGLRNTATLSRSYAPAGQRPVVVTDARRFGCSMISTVTNQGRRRFMLYNGALKVDILLTFLERLVRESRQRSVKYFLILDNLPVHHAATVKEWLARPDITPHLEVFHLPSYSPDLNPDEQLHSQVKSTLGNRPAAATSRDDLNAMLLTTMRSFQRQLHRILSFFQHPDTQYAAAA